MIISRIPATLSLLLTTLLLFPSATSAQNHLQAVAPRVVTPIDNTQRATLAGNLHPLAQARFDRGEVNAAEPTGRMMLVLERSASQQQKLSEYLAAVQDASSPSYHKWLTPTQYGELYGPAAQDIDAVTAWLKTQGFRVEKLAQAHNVIAFSGTMGQLKSTFRTSIHVFQIDGKTHYANVSDPQIPKALAGVIAGIARLDSFVPRTNSSFGGKAKYDTARHRFAPQLTLFTSSGTPLLFVDPADAATIYDTPNAALNKNFTGTTYDGTGVSIGVAGDSNVTMQDILNYREAFLGETAANANMPTVVVDGNDPLINGDEAEALLDTEIAGGIAPKAKVYLYTSDNTDLSSGLFNAIFRAIDDNIVSILNISFGACEANLGVSGNALMQEAAEQAAAQGISVTVSSGDSGSAGCDSDNTETAAQYGLAVNGLASSPYVTAVGGSDFDVLSTNFSTYVQDEEGGKQYSGTQPYYGTALSYIPEEPWNDSTYPNTATSQNTPFDPSGTTNIIGGGGGASQIYAKPAFQQSLTPADKSRDVPDVSFLAGNGLYSAIWAVCADSVAVGDIEDTYTDCQTSNGALTDTSTVSGFGGTSAATPAFAGMLALVEQKTGSRLGQADYVLYQLAKSKYAQVFHDIATGDNSVVCVDGSTNCGSNDFLTGYDAVTGYDQASGLGSVDAAQLVANWNTASLSATTTSLTINGSSAPVHVTHGTALTFDAAVDPSSASGVVGIVDNANEVANGPQNNGQTAFSLSSGKGSTIYNGLPGGTYSVYARYGGDATDAASSSAPIDVTIGSEPSTVGLVWNIYNAANTSQQITDLTNVPYGSYFIGDASVYGTAESASGTQGIATGAIQFEDGSAVLAGAVPLSSSNQASYLTPSTTYPYIFPIGQHSVTANYAGDASYEAATSSPVVFTVVRGATTESPYVQSSSLTTQTSTVLDAAVFTSSVGVFPTGTVTLTANGNTLATITSLLGGNNGSTVYADAKATLLGSSLAVGTNVITASYSGDANYAPSTGTVTVTVAGASFTLSNSGSISIAGGATTGNTATITASSTNGFSGLVNLSCSVTPSSANAPACSVPVSINLPGTSLVTTTLTMSSSSTTAPGVYQVAVTGTDAATGKVSASTMVNVAITGTAASASFAMSNSGNITVAPGATSGNTSSITVTPANGFSGAVTLSCSVAAGSATLAPTCSIPSTLTVNAGTTASATLTIGSTATASSSAQNHGLRDLLHKGAAVTLAVLLFFGIPARRKAWRTLSMLMLLGMVVISVGCGGSSSSGGGSGSGGTTAGSYSVTVSGVDAATGKISAHTTVSVTVQ